MMENRQLLWLGDNGLILIAYFLLALLFLLIAWAILQLYRLALVTRQKQYCIYIEPPARGDKQSDATRQLFVALHQLASPATLKEKLLGIRTPIALEILASKSEGIKYRLRISESKVETLRQYIVSFVPDAKTTVEDFSEPEQAGSSWLLRYRQQRHYAFPLQSQDFLESHDPIGYITASMTKLEPSERITYQLVIEPVRLREASRLKTKVLNNEDLVSTLSTKQADQHNRAFNIINRFLFGITDILTAGVHGHSKGQQMAAQKELHYNKQIAKRITPVRTLSYFEHELVESIDQKLSQPLFHVALRARVQVKRKSDFIKRRKGLSAALGVLGKEKYQALAPSLIYPWTKRYAEYLFDSGLTQRLFRENILSADEIASLYHFPNSIAAKTENVVKSLSRSLPAPVSLKSGSNLDVILGENHYHGSTTPIGLSASERERHVYIVGGTGNGKTTMLLYGIVQDIQNGKGVAVLDPHGDLADTILHYIPEERIQDVIYLNPDDLMHPVGINLLELKPDLSGAELEREKDLITEATISVMRKMFSDDDSGGHRIEYVLRNTIQTALTVEGATLFTIFRLLNDSKFRRSVVKSLEDQDLKNFWNNELGKAGEFQRVKMAAGITAKIGRFLFSASARRILEQEKSTVDFDEILNSSKILICNFSKGLLGEDTSTLFGTTVLAKLQVAALRRARIKHAERNPYHLYVDEFQNFATMSFVQMLSEARKYKLYLTMAEQSTSQQDQQRLVDIILANVGTVICFRSGSPADERYMLPLFSPYIEPGEIANLPAYSFYARIAAVHAQEPMSGTTVLLQMTGSQLTATRVIENSRVVYAKKREEAQSVDLRAVPLNVTPSKTSGMKKNQAASKAFNELDNAPKAA